MRSLITFLALFLIAAFGSTAPDLTANSQAHSYTSDKVGYVVDFPSPNWKLIDEPDDIHQNTEFVYGDRVDGYLRIRKENLEEGLTVREYATRDHDQ